MSLGIGDPKVIALNGVMLALKELKPEEIRHVLNTAAQWLGLQPGVSTTTNTEPQPTSGIVVVNNSEAKSASAMPAGNFGSAKDFLRDKNPTSDVQRVACLAYFLTHARALSQFKTSDIRKANTDARGMSMNIPRAVDNATRAVGFLAAVGGGKKQLTLLGEQVVDALPNQEKADQLVKSQGKRRRSSAKGKIKK
jgi:hypothetical protein